MFVPYVTSHVERQHQQESMPRSLVRRKGGGGRGGGGRSGGGSSGGSKSGGKTSSSSNKGSKAAGGKSSSVSTSSGSKSATSYGGGGGKVSMIPSGQLFAGRSVGGGTRDQVFGTKQYGSGYPGVPGRGVDGRGFPFYYWPIAWGGAGVGGAAYLHTHEYGLPDNSSRPGGPMATATFISSSQNTTFHVLSDNTTVSDLITDIRTNCSSSLSSSSSTSPSAFNPNATDSSKPEQAIQYYRASSVALTLDGYNNTGVLGAEGTPDTPLPSNIDITLLNCLNQTIGLAVPLVDGADVRWATPNMGLVALIWVFWSFSFYF